MLLDYKEMICSNRMSLVVSLPANDLELAKAALRGGAQALKVHLNVWHRASGNTFGTFRQQKGFLQELIALAKEKDVPVGLVPGADEAFITEEEMHSLEEMGIKFFSCYSDNLPAFMVYSKKIRHMVAIHNNYDAHILNGVRHSPLIDVLECSIMPGEVYGSPLVYSDVLRYTDVVQQTEKPVLIPTQKKILPSEVRALYDAGCKAVMIGAIVMGEKTPAECERATAAFREAVEAI